ncbi:putative ribonuclease H-like domain-containing protein [Tanacetum coccineum]
MDQDFAHMLAASKVPMLKPGEFELWRMRIKQYIQMIDYALWEVIENGVTLPKTAVVEGVEKVMPITSAKDKAQRRLEVKAKSNLMMGIPNEHQLKFNFIKVAKLLLEAVEKRFSGNAATKKTQRNLLKQNKAELETMSMDDLYNNLKVYEPEVKGMCSSSSSTHNIAFVSSSNNNTNNTNEAVNTAHGVFIASTQVNSANFININKLSDAVICSLFASQPNSPQLTHEDLQQIYPDDIKEMDLRWQMAMLTIRARGFLKNTRRKLTVNDNETIGFDKSKVKRSVPVETTTSTTLVSCDGLGGNDWSYQAEEGSNYALMAYSSLSSESEIVDNCKKGLGYEKYNAVSPPYIGNFMPPTPNLSFTGLDEFVNKPVVKNRKSDEEVSKVVKKFDDSPIIEDGCQIQQEKTARKSVKQVEKHRQNTHSPRGNQRNWNNIMSQKLRSNFEMFNKACYVCESFDHLQVDYNYHQKLFQSQRMVKPVWNNAQRVNHQNFAKKTHPYAKKNMVPRAVLMKSGLVSINITRQNISKTAVSVNTARQVNTAHLKTIVNAARPMSCLSKTAHSTVMRPIHKNTAIKNSNNKQRSKNLNIARPKAVVNAVKGNSFNAVKASACWVWKPKTKVLDHGNPQMDLQDQGVIDSGCSRHMTGNMSYLTDYEEIDGGYVAFGGNPKGGKITGKGTIKTGNLDFENVYFVRELKFNLFSVSQMCDKKNSVLFNDTECIVLSPNFKLIDESQVLLRVPRKNNMYSVDLKNIVPKGGLTCLFAKATSDESKLWHRRLGHLNFKTMNKLVKGNLVRGLPSKLFENDQTCVACQKGKQHRASCKSKTENSISLPLHLLHMDLFGPTFVKSLMKKMYCLVVTDDYSRFTWVFFLATKDETSGILKSFITGIENLVDHKVKVIRCDNGTEFKNKEMNQFCEMKGILRQFSVARTPQQNGVAERRNKRPN